MGRGDANKFTERSYTMEWFICSQVKAPSSKREDLASIHVVDEMKLKHCIMAVDFRKKASEKMVKGRQKRTYARQ